jgi:cytochrome c oxidase assembly factor CtaG
MSIPAFFTEWELDGTVGLIFTLLTVAVGVAYVTAAEIGRRRDRRARRWPLARTGSFIAGLAVLLFAIDSGVGAQADSRLSAHMVEHMLIWLAAAPLIVGGAPLRLAFFALASRGRRRLAGVLRSRPVAALTGPVWSTAIFATVIVVTHLPVVYDLTLRNDLVHVCEHALYLVAACLVWAPLIGADPLPHRPGPMVRATCVMACMVPMGLVSIWLLLAHAPVYAPYGRALGTTAALHDQRLAGVIMLVAGLPAFAAALAARLGAWPSTELWSADRHWVTSKT